MGGWLRHPHTTQERRLSLRVGEEYEVKVRGKRSFPNLPEAWDDIIRYNQRCWKSFRPTQYKVKSV